jgi:ubiquinone/menaquinone biosynthesis C-methylase UbiE
MPDPDPARAAAYWEDRHKIKEQDAHENFLTHPLVQAYISLRAFGNLTGHLDVVIAEIRSRTNVGARILSMGCGTAEKEMAIAAALPDRKFAAFDVAPDTIARAREQAGRRGLGNLELTVGDFNTMTLDPRSFDIVTMLGALHHVEALEHFWEQCRRALRPRGAVLAQEYVGPNRLQWTDRQIAAANDALRRIVPAVHQVHHSRVERTPIAQMLAADPSEAVRSSEILPTCKAGGFVVSGYASAGCALLQPVLMYQVHTFDPRNWEHNLVLATLFCEEDRLMREGVLGDDFAMFVAQPG